MLGTYYAVLFSKSLCRWCGRQISESGGLLPHCLAYFVGLNHIIAHAHFTIGLRASDWSIIPSDAEYGKLNHTLTQLLAELRMALPERQVPYFFLFFLRHSHVPILLLFRSADGRSCLNLKPLGGAVGDSSCVLSQIGSIEFGVQQQRFKESGKHGSTKYGSAA